MRTKRKRTKTATTPEPAPRLLFALLVLYLAVIPNSSSIAQAREHPKDYALIIGTVWGPDDRPVAGVNVKIRRVNDKKARWEVVSNHRGEFEQRLPVGKQDYVVWADLKGYKALNGKHLNPGAPVTVHIVNNERADTGLHLK